MTPRTIAVTNRVRKYHLREIVPRACASVCPDDNAFSNQIHLRSIHPLLAARVHHLRLSSSCARSGSSSSGERAAHLFGARSVCLRVEATCIVFVRGMQCATDGMVERLTMATRAHTHASQGVPWSGASTYRVHPALHDDECHSERCAT